MNILSEPDNGQARIEIHACGIDRDYFTKQNTDYPLNVSICAKALLLCR
jgi:hypothetical protein